MEIINALTAVLRGGNILNIGKNTRRSCFLSGIGLHAHGILLTLSELHGKISYMRVEQTDVISETESVPAAYFEEN